MDREAGHDRVEAAEVGKRLPKVMVNELDATLIREPRACRLEHKLGDVETHADPVGAVSPQQGEQASVARSQVQDPAGVARHVIE
jgi:hypothetical protein